MDFQRWRVEIQALAQANASWDALVDDMLPPAAKHPDLAGTRRRASQKLEPVAGMPA